MTKLLEEAFKKASELSEIEQNSLARWLLEELKSESSWQKSFADSEDELSKLADDALDEHAKGKTKKMETDDL
ncbi:MAG: hypothetical protein GF315_13740 [candidate division Zixibacteria bacterium]|nr:hypothetical protein [candidate division Zixibacteria bacterium]